MVQAMKVSQGQKCEDWELTVAENFVHILLWNPTDYALLDDFWIFPDDVLNNLQVLHSDLFLVSEFSFN